MGIHYELGTSLGAKNSLPALCYALGQNNLLCSASPRKNNKVLRSLSPPYNFHFYRVTKLSYLLHKSIFIMKKSKNV